MFRMADSPDGMIPRVVEKDLAAAAAFLQGTPLLVNASGEFEECGVDPALIAGFSLTPAGPDTSGFNILGTKEIPPGRIQCIAAQNAQRFLADYTGTLPAANGGTYGITEDATDGWQVDFAKTGGSARVTLLDRLTDEPESQPYVIVSVLTANIQPI